MDETAPIGYLPLVQSEEALPIEANHRKDRAKLDNHGECLDKVCALYA